ncbi:MAG TPA: S-layer protein [Planctomycetaceae bacterium]|nr:S-layer protein [Planctomycetaceae bacterium]
MICQPILRFAATCCWPAIVALSVFGGHSFAVGEPPEHSPKVIHFYNDVVPVLTKYGCNSGECHGRAGGQNGFKLSLLGYEPDEDYQHIVTQSRGRRVNPAASHHSLLLRKATNEVPHFGGKRLDPDSIDYATLEQWIRQGLPLAASQPSIQRIEVSPPANLHAKHATQQINVQAFYSDGSTRDVTHLALFDPVDPVMADVNETGLVTAFDVPGDTAITVRYQGQASIYRARIPMGHPLTQLPEAKNFVDTHVLGKLQSLGMPPSDRCDDSTFLRRVSLDIVGRLPSLEEIEQFLADPSDTKRDETIDRLLDSDEYAEFFANKWSGLLRNRRENASYERGCVLFHQWIRDSFAANLPYDRFVRQLLTASGDLTHSPAVAWYRSFKEPHLQMEDTAQLFLGTRLQCAQCHHHLFEKWSQEDYLSLAAFFSQVTHKKIGTGRYTADNTAEDIVVHKRGEAHMMNTRTNERITPVALGTQVGPISPDEDPRHVLADWMTDAANPLFAKALVNRYWKHFLNRGIVEPEDDLRDSNPPTNPELLDALANDFIAHGYDLKHLVRTITQSHVYQLSSLPNEANAKDQTNYAKYYPKRMMAEVLLDSVDTLCGSQSGFRGLPSGTRAVSLPDNSFNQGSAFLAVFGRPDSASACECERSMGASLSQNLHLMNADEIQSKLSNNTGRAATWAKDPRDNDAKIREMYLVALSREPTTAELTNANSYIQLVTTGKSPGDEVTKAARQAWEDLLWAMINTKEFLFHH